MAVGTEVIVGLSAYALLSMPVAVIVGRLLRGPVAPYPEEVQLARVEPIPLRSAARSSAQT